MGTNCIAIHMYIPVYVYVAACNDFISSMKATAAWVAT